MRKPIGVQIFDKMIKIRYVKSLYENDIELTGCYYKSKKLIKIVDNEQWKETLFHEVLHAVFHIKKHDKEVGHDLEESIVQNIEDGVYDLFAINEDCIRWVFKKKRSLG